MLFPVMEVENYAFWNEAVQNSHWKFIRDPRVSVISEVADTVRIWMKPANYDEGSFIDQYTDSKRISSCTLHQPLVLLEWEQHPTNEEWSGSNMSKRLLNIIKRPQLSLKKTNSAAFSTEITKYSQIIHLECYGKRLSLTG